VPTALARSVRRTSYLGVVLAESVRAGTTRLDVLAPRLAPARVAPLVRRIQDSWAAVVRRGVVRVVTLDSEECIEAGAELSAAGVEVRIARRELGSESLSYHLFGAGQSGTSTAIVNHHQDGLDRPGLVQGVVPVQPYRTHFSAMWHASSPLESVLAEKIIQRAGAVTDPRPVLRELKEISARLHLDPRCVDKLLPHLAFRHGCRVVLVVGLPGSGKSYVRRCLAAKLSALSIKSRGLTDYVFAYRDFLHEVTMLGPGPAAGFVPHAGGGFTAPDEAALAPALRALVQAARDSMDENEVTLVEFARADLIRALREFESLRAGAQVIHVMASETLRADRLSRRAEPPESILNDESITLRLSDNHALPSTAARTLYHSDGIAQLRMSRQWGRRIFEIDNDLDDGGARVDVALEEFVETVLRPYRVGAATPTQQPAPA